MIKEKLMEKSMNARFLDAVFVYHDRSRSEPTCMVIHPVTFGKLIKGTVQNSKPASFNGLRVIRSEDMEINEIKLA